MNRFKRYYRRIVYVLGAAVIIVAAIMGLLSMMAPLAVYAIQLHDLLMILFAIIDLLWIAYVVWSNQWFGELLEKEKRSPGILNVAVLGAFFFTGVLAASSLLLAIAVTAFWLADSHLTFFLASLLAILSVLVMLANLETRIRAILNEA